MSEDKIELLDIGVNLCSNQFEADRQDVIQNAITAGVTKMVVTGTTVSSSLAAVKLCRQYPENLRCTAGVHPHHADDFDSHTINQLTEIARNDSVVAIGEAGLDFNRNFSKKDAQINAFSMQLALAAETNLPLFLHCRDAHRDFVNVLSPKMPVLNKVVVHCFTGTADELDELLELGCYIGVTGWVCDERRGKMLREIVGRIPVEKLLIETDAPYLYPRSLKLPKKTRRNEPKFLPHIAEEIAACRGISPIELMKQTTQNGRQFFQFD